MMKPMYALVAAFAVLAFAFDAYAGCGDCGPKEASAEKKCCGTCHGVKAASAGTCSAEACSSAPCSTSSAACSASSCDASKGCPIAAAMAKLPKISYAVGEKKTGCPDAAAKMVKESGGHIHFCVGDTEYDSKSEAQAALLTATEKFVSNFAKPHTCPASGNVTLAGQTQSCEKSAAHTAKLLQDAMAKVKFSYAVGDEECHCPTKAARLAKDSGKEKLFVVGETKTCCEKTARLNLARAKYKAAVEAMVTAQAPLPKSADEPVVR
jgi:hypothetical protein